jgi:Zinc-finger associated domain (zf-AD)
MDSQENLCRLCLKESEDDVFSLFHFKNGHLIADLVKIICPISICQKEKDMPSKICSECLELIVDAIHLRDLSLMNEIELRRNLQEKNKNKYKINMKEEDPEVYVEALDEAALDAEHAGEPFEYSYTMQSDDEPAEDVRRNCKYLESSE